MESKQEIIITQLEMVESNEIKEFVTTTLIEETPEEQNKEKFNEAISKQKEKKMMQVPNGYTEEQVLAIIDNVVNKLGPSFTLLISILTILNKKVEL